MGNIVEMRNEDNKATILFNSPICRNPKNIFQQEAWAYFLACGAGKGNMPGAFATSFLKKCFVTANTLDDYPIANAFLFAGR